MVNGFKQLDPTNSGLVTQIDFVNNVKQAGLAATDRELSQLLKELEKD